MRAGLVQLCSGDDPAANLAATAPLVAQAAQGGARIVLTPEVTNIVSRDRALQHRLLVDEAHDPTLAALRAQARELRIWLLVGSLLLKADDPAEERFVNRSLLVAPDGSIAARYDKIHMFDAVVRDGERYRESAAICPGTRAVLSPMPVPLGLTICYDLRFPLLYRRLAQAGAAVITVPSAFTVPTGAAHWQVLLRARAIETGCFILAPAQCGTHPLSVPDDRPARQSWGHSLAVSPWGEVIANGGEKPGVTLVDLDLRQVEAARARIGSLATEAAFSGP